MYFYRPRKPLPRISFCFYSLMSCRSGIPRYCL